MEYTVALIGGVFIILFVMFIAGLIMYESDSFDYKTPTSRLGARLMKISSLTAVGIIGAILISVAINLIVWGLTMGDM